MDEITTPSELTNADEIIEFTHPALNSEIEAVSGHYMFIKEGRLTIDNREVLFFVGYAIVDTSCCAPGGMGFALVPGFVRKWKFRSSVEGQPISLIERIRDTSIREEIERRLKASEMTTQVTFR